MNMSKDAVPAQRSITNYKVTAVLGGVSFSQFQKLLVLPGGEGSGVLETQRTGHGA